jgi:hypothetical protein
VTRHTRPDESGLALDEPGPPPPPRPVTVELAAALLIVGGVINLIGGISSIPGLPPGTVPLFAVTVALAMGSIVVGLLVRLGRVWLVAVNLAAVLGFLDLLAAGASPLSLMLGLSDILVVVILFRNKPWFDALQLRRTSADAEDQPLTPPTARPPTR